MTRRGSLNAETAWALHEKLAAAVVNAAGPARSSVGDAAAWQGPTGFSVVRTELRFLDYYASISAARLGERVTFYEEYMAIRPQEP